MVFLKSSLNKFILSSLIIHLLVVGAVLEFSHEEDKLIPVEITFSPGASSGFKSSGASEIMQVKKTKPTPPKVRHSTVSDVAEIKSDAVSDKEEVKPGPVAPSHAGSGGQGTNIGTGTEGEGFGSTPGMVTAKNKYFSLIAQTIYKNKRYPRQAYSLNQEGLVVVRLRLDKNGNILEVKVLEKAPFKSLTDATIETINTINKFPPIPGELGLSEITFRIPIEYKIQM